jgi:hypothetical protein
MSLIPKKESAQNLECNNNDSQLSKNKFFSIQSKKRSSVNFEVLALVNHSDSKQTILILENGQIDPRKHPKKTIDSEKLKKLLAFYGIKMSLLLPRMIWNVSSVTENKFEKLCKEEEDQLQDFLRHYFLRIYPSGKRIDSSNYDPIKCFNFGVQMTALNMQTADQPLLLYHTRFRQNGGRFSGYVLKPDYLLKESYKYLKDFTKICKVTKLI